MDEMIDICKTPEWYNAILRQMVLDQKYRYGRLYVPTIFTKDVCKTNPDFSRQIVIINLAIYTLLIRYYLYHLSLNQFLTWLCILVVYIVIQPYS